MSLVKGVPMTLKAVALSVKRGGSIGKAPIGGELRTSGADVITLEVDAVRLQGGNVGGLDRLTIRAPDGESLTGRRGVD